MLRLAGSWQRAQRVICISVKGNKNGLRRACDACERLSLSRNSLPLVPGDGKSPQARWHLVRNLFLRRFRADVAA